MKEGDEVILVSGPRPEGWNTKGDMDAFLDKQVILHSILPSSLMRPSERMFRIKEDPESWIFWENDIAANITELTEEVKKRYPIGSEFYAAHIAPARTHVCNVSDYDKMLITGEKTISLYSSHPGNCHSFSGIVCYRGKWAEVVKKNEPPSFKFNIGDTVEIRHAEGKQCYAPWGKLDGTISSVSSLGLKGVIKERTEKGLYKWYLTTDYDNWITEGSLELVMKLENNIPKSDWCVQLTEDNREVIKKWMDNTNYGYYTGNYYGEIEDEKVGSSSPFNNSRILSTEQFYDKIGHFATLDSETETIYSGQGNHSHYASIDYFNSMFGDVPAQQIGLTEISVNKTLSDFIHPIPSFPSIFKSQKTSNKTELYIQQPVKFKKKNKK